MVKNGNGNGGGKCRYFNKGCLEAGGGCEADQVKSCGRGIAWEKIDAQKCPAVDFKDGCDIPDMRRLIISDAGRCYADGQCLRRLYPEIQISISRNPDLRAIAKSIIQRRSRGNEQKICSAT